MRSIIGRQMFSSCAKTGALGLVLVGLVSCSAGESPTGTVATGGSAALQGPLVFMNNTGAGTLTTVALRGDSGNAIVNTLGPGVFGGGALGDMQFSLGEWVFVNLGSTNQVATIDPLTRATPVHEVNLTAGTRPVHIYRDPTDREVMWIMNDGNNARDVSGNLTPYQGDDLINCVPVGAVPGQNYGSSVTIIHNSHVGPGATSPTVERTVCVLADGHKVAAFSQPTATNASIPYRAFVSSSTAGEIAVIDNSPVLGANPNWRLINRIDLCDPTREACDSENSAGTTPFTPNNSNPHGIRWSQLTGKVYSIQENYRTIVEIDPTTLGVTLVADLSTTNYTAFGISPDGRFLLLRGSSPAPSFGTRLGVIDLAVPGNPRTIVDLNIPALNGFAPGAFKFSPDGQRFYILAGNTATGPRDFLFAFDASTLTTQPSPALTLLRAIGLTATLDGRHSFDVLAQRPAGAPVGTLASVRYLVVSNGTDNSISIINAATNQVVQNVQVGTTPGAVMVYYPGSVVAGGQATSSLTGGYQESSVPLLPERLDDHGMPE